MAGHISDSANIDWCSPLWITDGVAEVLGGRIDIDPCGNPGSLLRVKAKMALTLDQGDDGLVDSWHTDREGNPNDNFYVNPPFGRYYMHPTTKEILLPKEMKLKLAMLHAEQGAEAAFAFQSSFALHSIDDWTNRCVDEHQRHGLEGCQLRPGNFDTKNWQDKIEPSASAILYIRGRLKFELVDFTTLEVVKTGPAPMACALVYWGSNPDLFAHVFEERGGRGRVHILQG